MSIAYNLKIMHGYTGTQNPGPNALYIVRQHLEPLAIEDHCIINGLNQGTDAIIGRVAYELGFKVLGILPADRSKVARDYERWCYQVYEMPAGTSYMQRNDEIVRLSDILTAFPTHEREQLRSGTWATIRRARKKRIRVEIISVGSGESSVKAYYDYKGGL